MTRTKTPEHNTIRTFLSQRLSPERVRHTTGTVTVARSLALRYGVPAAKAELAALLHDAGKSLRPREMVRYVRCHGLRVPFRATIERRHPSLLHSFISAHIAATKFRVRDRAVLSAIANHTVGGQRMSPLAKIIYIADIISPERRTATVTHIRRESRRDLDAAFRSAVMLKISYVLRKKEWIHPTTISLWNSLIEQK